MNDYKSIKKETKITGVLKKIGIYFGLSVWAIAVLFPLLVLVYYFVVGLLLRINGVLCKNLSLVHQGVDQKHNNKNHDND